jgi:hypothetical protein
MLLLWQTFRVLDWSCVDNFFIMNSILVYNAVIANDNAIFKYAVNSMTQIA